MDKIQRARIEMVINQLLNHDPWMHREFCNKMLQEADWDAPAVVECEGDYTTARFILHGREFELSYQYGGFRMGYVLSES